MYLLGSWPNPWQNFLDTTCKDPTAELTRVNARDCPTCRVSTSGTRREENATEAGREANPIAVSTIFPITKAHMILPGRGKMHTGSSILSGAMKGEYGGDRLSTDNWNIWEIISGVTSTSTF
jgi:hypothetical protein